MTVDKCYSMTVDKCYQRVVRGAYNGPRLGIRRPAEPERGGPQLPALPAGPVADTGGPWNWAGRRADHDRRRGTRPERGSTGGAVRRRGGQAARPVAAW